MGGDAAPPPVGYNVNETMDSVLAAYQKNLPGLVKTTSENILPYEQAQLEASKQVSPQYSALMNQLYSQYAPGLNKIGTDIEQQNKLAAAKGDLSVLQGPGAQLADTAQSIDKRLNPEFYRTREATSSGVNSLLSSLNIDRPNVEAERLVNQENQRSGNVGNTNATGTVSNALQFGNERLKRANALGQALNSATSFLQPSKASFDPFGRQTGQNTGESKFTGVTQTGAGAGQLGNNLLGGLTQGAFQTATNNANINANRRDSLDKVTGVMGSLPNVS